MNQEIPYINNQHPVQANQQPMQGGGPMGLLLMVIIIVFAYKDLRSK